MERRCSGSIPSGSPAAPSLATWAHTHWRVVAQRPGHADPPIDLTTPYVNSSSHHLAISRTATAMITIDHYAYPHIIDTIWSCMAFADLLVARLACSEWRQRASRRLQRHMEVRPHREGLLLCTKDFREATQTLKLPRYYVTRHMLARTRPLHPLAVASEPWLAELFANIKVLDFEWRQLSGIAQQTFLLLQQRLDPETMVRVDAPYQAPRVLPPVAIAGRTQVYWLDIGSRQGLCTMNTDKVVINLTCYTNARSPMCHGHEFTIWDLLNPDDLDDAELVIAFSHDAYVRMYLPGTLVFTHVYAQNLLTWLDTCWYDRKVSIVGADYLWDEQWQRDMFCERLEEQLAERKKQLAAEQGDDATPLTKEGSLRFFTYSEYQNEAGNEAYWLHTLWDSSHLGPYIPDIMDNDETVKLLQRR